MVQSRLPQAQCDQIHVPRILPPEWFYLAQPPRRNRKVLLPASHPLTSDSTCFFRGLGAVLARTFAAEGCNVAINFQSSEAAASDLAKAIGEEYGVKTATVKAVNHPHMTFRPRSSQSNE